MGNVSGIKIFNSLNCNLAADLHSFEVFHPSACDAPDNTEVDEINELYKQNEDNDDFPENLANSKKAKPILPPKSRESLQLNPAYQKFFKSKKKPIPSRMNRPSMRPNKEYVKQLLKKCENLEMEKKVFREKYQIKKHEVKRIAEINKFHEQKLKTEKKMLSDRIRNIEKKKVLSLRLGTKRANIVKEFYLSEKAYVSHLQVLKEYYIEPLIKKKIMSDEVVTNIFNNFEIVYETNVNFLLALEQVLLSYEREESLINLILENTELFLSYSEYMKYFKKVSEIIRKKMEKSKKFLRFVNATMETLKNQNQRIYTLNGLLLTPIQRLPRYFLHSTYSIIRYKLLLTDLKKHTQKEKKNFLSLKKSISVLDDVIRFCATKSKEFQQTLRVSDINVDFNLDIDPMVYKSLLRLDEDETDIIFLSKKGRKQKRSFIVLNCPEEGGLLIITNKKRGILQSLNKDVIKLPLIKRKTIILNKTVVEKNEENLSVTENILSIESKGVKVKLKFGTVEELKSFKETLLNSMKKVPVNSVKLPKGIKLSKRHHQKAKKKAEKLLKK